MTVLLGVLPTLHRQVLGINDARVLRLGACRASRPAAAASWAGRPRHLWGAQRSVQPWGVDCERGLGAVQLVLLVHIGFSPFEASKGKLAGLL